VFTGRIRDLDKAQAEALVGKTIAIAVTFVSHDGARDERCWYGTITRAEPPSRTNAGFLRVDIEGESVPWALAGDMSIRPATPAERSRFLERGVAAPDYIEAYDVALPDPNTLPRATPQSEQEFAAMMREYMAACPAERPMLGEIIASYDKELWGHFNAVDAQGPATYDRDRCLHDLRLLVAVGDKEDPRDVTYALDAVIKACAALPQAVVMDCYDEAAALAEANGSIRVAKMMREYPSIFWRSASSNRRRE
jgi:hypothetical protein